MDRRGLGRLREQPHSALLHPTATFRDGNSISLIDPRVEGHTLTFKLPVNETEVVTLKGAISGNRIEGAFEGRDSGKGTFAGVKTP